MTLLSLVFIPSALAWPDDTEWRWLEDEGSPLGDVLSQNAPAVDIIGDDAAPAGAWAVDADSFYVRIRVEGSIDGVDGGWGVLFETTGDDVVEVAVVAETAATAVRAYTNVGGEPGSTPPPSTWGAPVVWAPLTDTVFRTSDGGGHTVLVDLALPRQAMVAQGLTPDLPWALRLVTGASPFLPWEDTTTETTPLVIDADLDGLVRSQELDLGSNPNDADTDDDGVLDGAELAVDSDGDGVLDLLDCDSDDDGLPDGLEAGVTRADAHEDTYRPTGCFVPDRDPDTTTDPTQADTDGGGLSDGDEDWNHDGAVDGFETDPTVDADDVDTDMDGIADAVEVAVGASPGVDDTDGDGLLDSEEGPTDPDGDGLPAFVDLDSDADGFPDGVEGLDDLDGDGLPDFLDVDSDGDGLADFVEGDVDSDGDGDLDRHDEDSDDDGIPDAREAGKGFPEGEDFDGDGQPDYLDLDSDNDGLPDALEGPGDADGDGKPNTHESDSDNDGFSDAYEGIDDPDLDGLGNFEDVNSDGEFGEDAVDGDGDGDCDGIPDFLDPDEEDSFCGPPPPIPEIAPRPEPPPRTVIDGRGCQTAPGFTGAWVLVLLWGRRLRES